jgi:hypothetical protein
MSLGAVLGLPADPVRRPCLTGWRAQTRAASRATVRGNTTSRSYCSPRCTTNERAPAAGVQPPDARTGECGPLSWRPDRRAFGHRRPTRTEPALTRPTRGGSVARKCHSRALAMVSNATSGRHLDTPELPIWRPSILYRHRPKAAACSGAIGAASSLAERQTVRCQAHSAW